MSVTPLTALWLPILVSAVVVFIASSIVHMVIKWHDSDFPKLPDEAQFRSAVGPMAIPPGDYMVPRAMSGAEMRTPEFIEKCEKGPVVIMTVIPPGQMELGKSLGLWFVYCLVVSFFAAYIAGRALGPGHVYLEVFRFVGASAFMGYALGLWQGSIWYRRKWSSTIKSTVDGLIYAMLTAGVFGWLWPR